MLSQLDWEPVVTLLELLSQNPQLKNFVQVVSMVILVAGLYRYILKPSWRFHWKVFDAADQILKTIPVILEIAKDFRPNSGSSLRDVVNRIEYRQISLESRVKALLTTSNGPLFEADESGQWIWVNRALCDLTGYLPEQIIGYGWLNLICQDYQVEVTAQWNLAINQKRDIALEFDLVTRSDKVIPVKLETTVLKSNNIILGFIGKIVAVPTALSSPLQQSKPLQSKPSHD